MTGPMKPGVAVAALPFPLPFPLLPAVADLPLLPAAAELPWSPLVRRTAADVDELIVVLVVVVSSLAEATEPRPAIAPVRGSARPRTAMAVVIDPRRVRA